MGFSKRRLLEIAQTNNLREAMDYMSTGYYVLLDNGGKTCISEKINNELAHGNPRRLDFTDFSRLFSNVCTKETKVDPKKPDKVKVIIHNVAKCWLNSPTRLEYYGTVMVTDGGDVPENYVNLFQGFPYFPVPNDNDFPHGGSYICYYVKYVLCSGDSDLFDYFMWILGNAIYNPDKRLDKYMVLSGDQGCGKSTIFKIINRLLEKHFVNIDRVDQVIGTFNTWMGHAFVVGVDEAHQKMANNRFSNAIKEYCTSDRMNLRGMYKEHEEAINRMFFILVHDQPDKFLGSVNDKENRRLMLIRANSGMKGNEEFFIRLNEEIESDHIGWFSHLLRVRMGSQPNIPDYLRSSSSYSNYLKLTIAEKFLCDIWNRISGTSSYPEDDLIRSWLKLLPCDDWPGMRFSSRGICSVYRRWCMRSDYEYKEKFLTLLLGRLFSEYKGRSNSRYYQFDNETHFADEMPNRLKVDIQQMMRFAEYSKKEIPTFEEYRDGI